jgi:hypothetical protein
VPAERIVIEMLQELQFEVGRLRRAGSGDSPGRGRGGPAAIAAVAAALSDFHQSNPSASLLDLVNSSEFISELESKVEAPRYFDSPIDFRRTVEESSIGVDSF